jgi:MFS family permease
LSLADRALSSARSYAGLDRRIWTLAAVRGANTMGLSLVLSFMGLYLVTQRGVSGLHYGLIYFTANICQALTSTYAGQLSDRVGRRRLMVSTLVARALVIASLGALVLVHAPVAVLAMVIIVSACLRGGFEPIASAVVADVAAPPDRVAAFGLQRMGINLGWAVGPGARRLPGVVIDYGEVFFCAVIPLFVSALVMARLENRQPPPARRPPRPASRCAPHCPRPPRAASSCCSWSARWSSPPSTSSCSPPCRSTPSRSSAWSSGRSACSTPSTACW